MAQLSKMVISYNIAPEHLDRLQREFPEIRFTVCSDTDSLAAELPDSDAWFGAQLDLSLLAGCPTLCWMQSTSAGVDKLLGPELIERDIVLTNFSGVQASAMGEHLLSMMYVFARGLPTLLRRQVLGEWTTQPPDEHPRLPQTRYYSQFTFELRDQTLAILGLGDVGCELAWRAKGVGMRVVGSKRRPSEPPDGVDRLFGPDDWYEMLGEADHVAICLPLTSRTHQLIGEAEFNAMKSTAYIYNTSRGVIIDQDALIEALRSGEIAGAGLDVTTPEPLPADNPLWYMPNVLITSHTSGASPNIEDRGIEVVVENIHRYIKDQPLLNVVDKVQGY